MKKPEIYPVNYYRDPALSVKFERENCTGCAYSMQRKIRYGTSNFCKLGQKWGRGCDKFKRGFSLIQPFVEKK